MVAALTLFTCPLGKASRVRGCLLFSPNVDDLVCHAMTPTVSGIAAQGYGSMSFGKNIKIFGNSLSRHFFLKKSKNKPMNRLYGTECWGDFNPKQLMFKKFLQNPFLGCQWSP